MHAIEDPVSALLYDGFSSARQAISELSAFGSPVRPLMLTAILPRHGHTWHAKYYELIFEREWCDTDTTR
jgi:hypothetical protein